MTLQTRLAALEKKVQELENKSCTESLEKAEVLGSHKTVLAPDAQQLQGMACASEVLDKIMQLLENQKASFVEMLETKIQQFECKVLAMELSVKSALKQNVQEMEVQLLKSQKSALKAKVQQLECKICHVEAFQMILQVVRSQKEPFSETLDKKVQELEKGRTTLEKNMQELRNSKPALEQKVQLLKSQKSALKAKVHQLESTTCIAIPVEKTVHPLEDQKASSSETLEKTKVPPLDSATCHANTLEQVERKMRELVNKPIGKVVRPLEGQALTAEQPKDGIQQLPIQTPILPKSPTTTKNNTKALTQTTNSPTAIAGTNNENKAETVNGVANCSNEGNMNKPTPAATTSPAELDKELVPTYLNLIPPDMRKKARLELAPCPSAIAVSYWCRSNNIPAVPVYGRFAVTENFRMCCMTPDKRNVVTWHDILGAAMQST